MLRPNCILVYCENLYQPINYIKKVNNVLFFDWLLHEDHLKEIGRLFNHFSVFCSKIQKLLLSFIV